MVIFWNILYNLEGSKKLLGLENKMIFLLGSYLYVFFVCVDICIVEYVFLEIFSFGGCFYWVVRVF